MAEEWSYTPSREKAPLTKWLAHQNIYKQRSRPEHRPLQSASLLNDQPLQIYPGSSASSSDLLSSSKPLISSAATPLAPLRSTTSSMPVALCPKTTCGANVPPYLQSSPTSHRSTPSPTQNYSNRNNAPPYPQPQQRGPPKTPDMWAKERMLPSVGQRGTLQRQGSGSSGSPMCMPDPRRMPGMEGEYMTYRDIHAAGRGPLQMSQALHRPLSARTYSMDGPNTPRPQSARPPPHELPERTMSVSDFNYQHGSPRQETQHEGEVGALVTGRASQRRRQGSSRLEGSGHETHRSQEDGEGMVIFWTSFKVVIHFCSWNPPFCWDQNNPGVLDQKYPNLTKMFWTTQTEDLIQIKTKILWSNPFFFWTTHFQDLIQSDGQNPIRLL